MLLSLEVVNWIGKIEVIGERRNNLEDQVQVLKILNNFCSDNGQGKDLLSIQKRIRIQLFNIGTNPMKRGVLFFQSESSALVQSSHMSKGLLNEMDEMIPDLQPLKPQLSNYEMLNLGENSQRYSVKIFKPSNSREGLL